MHDEPFGDEEHGGNILRQQIGASIASVALACVAIPHIVRAQTHSTEQQQAVVVEEIVVTGR